ncbi:hypothetical protein Rfer_4458 (plasmid) [Rhodoferax ferrireducens T118]|uniref:Uncharacterized protein n=1 Tax=Albidiferax ferrireducens (strain ATCC BAA-621 / DSM 15236 / T118) TaxID=338969 RepID=Q21Q01_ALBFT|nr:hypothetical protein Rfer_4458 [Rhodoferax ferrireducens T118]
MANSNFHAAAKLACTASALSFEEWQRRPVYRAHCKTAAIARAMCNVQTQPGHGLATRFGLTDHSGLDTFRALAPYRTSQAVRLRNQVAKAIKNGRKAGNLKLQVNI